MSDSQYLSSKEVALKTLERLQKNSKFHDVTFKINDDTFTAVRAVFASHSPVFEAMLYGQCKEADPNEDVIINDISPTAFKVISDYLHGLAPKIPENEVATVLYAAEKYMIPGLVEDAKKAFCKLSSTKLKQSVFLENCDIAVRYGLTEHISHVLEETEFEVSSSQILNCSKLSTFSVKFMLLIFEKWFCIEHEDRWSIAVKWSGTNQNSEEKSENIIAISNEKQAEEAKNRLNSIIDPISFEEMDPIFVESDVEPVGLLSPKRLLDIYKFNATQVLEISFVYTVYSYP